MRRGACGVRPVPGQRFDDREDQAGQHRQRDEGADHDQHQEPSRPPLRRALRRALRAAAHPVHPLPVIESKIVRITV